MLVPEIYSLCKGQRTMKNWITISFTIYLVQALFSVVFARCRRKEDCSKTRRVSDTFDANVDWNVDGTVKDKPANKQSTHLEVAEKKVKRCCPYDFDSSRCKVVDDRVLCGYNRNIGWPKSKLDETALSEGCRLRGGRLECGYVGAPYYGIRRPPAWQADMPNSEQNTNNADNDEDIVTSGKLEENLENLKKYSTPISHNKVKTEKPKCIEINDRIVCPSRKKG